jgi:hypothetical protein
VLEQKQQQQQQVEGSAAAAVAAPPASISSGGGGACIRLCVGAAGSAAGDSSRQLTPPHGDLTGSAAFGNVAGVATALAAADSEQQYRQALALVDLAVGSVLDAAEQQQQQHEHSTAGLEDGAMWLECAVLLLQLHQVGLQT